MSAFRRLLPAALRSVRDVVSRPVAASRLISNSPKTLGGASSSSDDQPVVKTWRDPANQLPKEFKEWTPFLHPFDKEKDEFVRRGAMFCVIVVMFCWMPFIWAYGPDHSLQNWAYREAFLEIERRKKAGQPLISPDLIEADKVVQHLPSEEELGDMEIII